MFPFKNMHFVELFTEKRLIAISSPVARKPFKFIL